ncbi:MAG: radical SAM protein [Selenomonadaceae bacterium]|nr:radical SAM protein [Selenomonadaceae bacterium]
MRFMHCGREEFLKRTENRRLVLFGASVQPHEVELDLREKFGVELSDYVDGIVDNGAKKWGTDFSVGSNTLKIESPAALRKKDWSKAAILITSRFYLEIIKQLDAMPELCEAEVYAWPCVILDMELTPEGKYERRITGEAIKQYNDYLKAVRCDNEKKEQMLSAVREKISAPGYRVLPRVVLMHSNICTLHCKYCCDLIPQVKKTYYIRADEIIKNLQLLLTGVDMCVSADLTDGEGLLYRELDTLLEFLLNEDKIETVLLMSNGTVIPKESTLNLMRHPKFWINFSDYGVGEKFQAVRDKLNAYDIQYTVNESLVWKDFGVHDLKKREESRELLRYEFLRCCNKMCSKAYIDRKLYACMPAFRMSNLGIYQSDKDYIQINETDTPSEIWEKIVNLCMINYIDACDYCNFENTGVPFVPIGN